MTFLEAPVAVADTQTIERAAGIIRLGGLVAFPTETVYGLGADATNDAAVARIFAAKGRPRFNPLIVHIASLADARKLASFPPGAVALARAFWPGALTLVLPRLPATPVSRLASAGLDTVALRVPDHAIAQALLAAAGAPIAAPSANRSGELSPTRAKHVADSLGAAVDLVLDGGATSFGIESTIVGFDAKGPVLLRPGAIPRQAIEQRVGPLRDPGQGPVSAPGQLQSHYAPRTPLRLEADEVFPGEALLAFGPNSPSHHGLTRNLSLSGDLVEAAANLFAMLHEIDAAGCAGIAVAPVPRHGLGEAINDRLRRAAADKAR